MKKDLGPWRPGVRAISNKSIELDFRFMGKRYRERLKLAPNATNKRFAENMHGRIQDEIGRGLFDYAKTFPGSRRAPAIGLTISTGEALITWLLRKDAELQHSTMVGYRRMAASIWLPAVGHIALNKLEKSHLRAVLDEHCRDCSAKRANNVLGPMRSMLVEACSDGLIPSNPADGLVVKRRAKLLLEEVDPFSPEEIRAIVAAADPGFRAFCMFNFATGLRTSEMIALRWGSLSPATEQGWDARISEAWVMGKLKTTKTAAGTRTIALLPMAIGALRQVQGASQVDPDARVFLDAAGLPWKSDREIREVWARTLTRAGVRYRYPYQMRHTFASQALSAGENVMWVAKQMGHKDWTVTARKYARFIPSIIPDAGQRVQALWANVGA